MLWTVLNPILVLELCNLLRCFLCLMHANDLTLLNQSNIFSMTTRCVLRLGCLRNEKLLIASVGVESLVCQLKDNYPCNNYPIGGSYLGA